MTPDPFSPINIGGYTAPPLQVPMHLESEVTSSFNGTINDLSDDLSELQSLKNNINAKLAALGEAQKTTADLADDDDDDDDTVIESVGATISVFDSLNSLYQQYLPKVLQLNADAATYQKSWQAYIDNVYGEWAGTNFYYVTLAGISALPVDFNGLRATPEMLKKFGEAFQTFGDGSAFQAKLGDTVFITAKYTHKTLETIEYGAGLLSGGTITAATLTTKAGFAALAKRIARNYAENIVADATGVHPSLISAGIKSLQGAALLKSAKSRIAQGPRFDASASFNQTQKYGEGRARQILRDNMNLSWGPAYGRVAHHLIPLNFRKDPQLGQIVRRAVKGGFDINGIKNGKYLDPSDHVGSHPGYDGYVANLIRTLYTPGMSNKDCATMLEQVATLMRNVKPSEL